jgi:hypothetical protein
MTSELTGDQERILKSVFDNIPIVRDLGLEKTSPCILDLHDTFGDLKLVTDPSPDDRLVVWAKFNMEGNFEEKGFDDVRDFVIDGVARIPKYSFRYINPGINIFDGLDPSNCRRYTYGQEEVRYPWKDAEKVPFKVSRQVVEVFDLIPDTVRLKLGKRTNVLVNRMVYQNPPRSGDIFAPFSLVSSSVFVRAPGDHREGLLGTEGEWWLESKRIFRFKKEEITYLRSSSGDMQKHVKGVFVFSEVGNFLPSLGASEEIFFPEVKLPSRF